MSVAECPLPSSWPDTSKDLADWSRGPEGCLRPSCCSQRFVVGESMPVLDLGRWARVTGSPGLWFKPALVAVARGQPGLERWDILRDTLACVTLVVCALGPS